MLKSLSARLLGTVAFCAAVAGTAHAEQFDIPAGDLKAGLDAYAHQSGIGILFSSDVVKGAKTRGVRGDLSAPEALSKILAGTGFATYRDPDGSIGISRQGSRNEVAVEQSFVLAQATPAPRAAVETVTVTSSKLGGADVQSIPIAITALSQEQLTSRQVAGGPDLVKEIPNLTFTKTNFTGYSIQIRGIGTQAISVTTDPAVAVALNDIPFIRNHFFEQEFYDLSQAEVLRGPQGTLYGRNATAGVVNLVTAKPTDQFEAMASADIGNYKNRRFEAMVNLPLVDDRFDLRVAGEWTKRSGYTTNTLTGNQVDGRDLWSSRVSVAWKPLEHLKATLVWEHFQENDDRMRTAKQLCHTDPGPSSVDGIPIYPPGTTLASSNGLGAAFTTTSAFFSQGCLPASLYAPESFQVPNGFSLPMVTAGWVSGGIRIVNPYVNATQSTNLRNIETTIDPRYTAKNNTVELNVDYNVTPELTFTSQTGFNQDFLWSTEDYNRFNTAANLFIDQGTGTSRKDTLVVPNGNYVCNDGTVSIGGDNCVAGGHGAGIVAGDFCDPQLGCSSRLVAQDISVEHAWQASQEFRLASNFSGPFNFSIGGNYLHYETEENYYVFSNMLTMFAATSGAGPAPNNPWIPGVTTNLNCFTNNRSIFNPQGRDYSLDSGIPTESCYFIDPNPLESVNDLGHNYFLSQNPYTLNSYAGFGEAYYNILPDLKLTGGLRWTDDKKHFVNIPSELFTASYGYFISGDVDQRWAKFTGRFAANWTPKLDFTDQTLLYGSFSHGYKAGGANPPGAVLTNYFGDAGNGVPIHPATFDPEYIDAYELGTKNTLADGALTLNGNMFFYNYTGYQISEIVDRTSINLNVNATVKGAELEATYEPLPGLKFNFAGGYEQTRVKNGQSAIDLMDRTAGHSDWMLMKPFPTQASNCIFPDYVVAALVLAGQSGGQGTPSTSACGLAYNGGYDPALGQSTYYYNNGAPYAVHSSSCGSCYSGPYPYTITPSTLASQYAGYTFTYPGFDPRAGTPGDPYQGQNTYNGHDYGPAPNNGEGFAKDLGGNELPNAPHFTVSASVDYTLPVTPDWASTFHVDYYWQDYSWARVFNDNPYDRLRGYTNVNLALILTSQNGWQVMGYLKNIFNVTDVTGAFLNSDDSGLTTNIFLTDPRLFGIRVTKNW